MDKLMKNPVVGKDRKNIITLPMKQLKNEK